MSIEKPDASRFLGAFKDQPTRPESPSFLVPPKCEVCKDTGEVEARVQYHTPHGRSCRMEKRPCPFCENGADMDRKQIPATK